MVEARSKASPWLALLVIMFSAALGTRDAAAAAIGLQGSRCAYTIIMLHTVSEFISEGF